MAQNPYLQNLLGINPPGMGLMRYEYTMPNYQSLLNQGLTPSDIAGKDPYWGRFGQYPFVLDPATNQVSVPGQAPDVAAVNPSSTPEEQVTIDYSQQQDMGPSFQEEQQMKIKEDFPLGQGYAKTMSEFSDDMMERWGLDKGYIDKDGFLSGPMQVSGLQKMGLMGNMLAQPAQILNNRQYNNWLDQARRRGMFYEMAGKPGETFGRVGKSISAKRSDSLAKSLNELAKKDDTGIFSKWSPIGKDNKVHYVTSSGGFYDGGGKYVNPNTGITSAYGSMTDAIEYIKSASDSGKTGEIDPKLIKRINVDSVNVTEDMFKKHGTTKEEIKEIIKTSKQDNIYRKATVQDDRGSKREIQVTEKTTSRPVKGYAMETRDGKRKARRAY